MKVADFEQGPRERGSIVHHGEWSPEGREADTADAGSRTQNRTVIADRSIPY